MDITTSLPEAESFATHVKMRSEAEEDRLRLRLRAFIRQMWLASSLGAAAVIIAVVSFAAYRNSFADMPKISMAMCAIGFIGGSMQIVYVMYQILFGVAAESKLSLRVIRELRVSVTKYRDSLQSVAHAEWERRTVEAEDAN